jgi:hypothetical protein
MLGETRREVDGLRIAPLQHAELRREEKIVESAAANRGKQIGHGNIIAKGMREEGSLIPHPSSLIPTSII